MPKRGNYTHVVQDATQPQHYLGDTKDALQRVAGHASFVKIEFVARNGGLQMLHLHKPPHSTTLRQGSSGSTQ